MHGYVESAIVSRKPIRRRAACPRCMRQKSHTANLTSGAADQTTAGRQDRSKSLKKRQTFDVFFPI